MEKKNYPEITALRGMAILMVLFYHSIIVYPIDIRESVIWDGISMGMWYVQMPLFFIVSGFCFQYDGNYGRYAVKKIKRILVPHVALGIVDLAFRILPGYIPALQGMVNQQTDWQDGIVVFLLMGGEDPFLRALFLASMIYPLVHMCIKKTPWSRLPIYGAFIAMYLCSEYITNVMALSYLSQFMIYFSLGYELRAHNWEKLKEKMVSIGFAGLSLACCVLAAYCYYNYDAMEYITIPIALMGAWFLLNVVSIMRGPVARFVQASGNYSLPLYLLDGYVLVVTRWLFVGKCGIEQPIAVVLLNFAVDTTILLLITHWIIVRIRPIAFLFGMNVKKREK